jgi:hypothetical protein
MRLVNALQAGGTLSTTELCAKVADLPKATVYRHVERLLRGGVFEVESEHRVRGAVERRYRLSRAGAVLDADAVRTMTLEDHRSAFTAAMGALLAEFNGYLDGGGAEPEADHVSYKQMVLWLSRAERSRLVAAVTKHLGRYLANERSADRIPYRLSTIFFPTGDAPGTQGARPPGRRARATRRRRS